jgi:hypothetical protein
MDWIERCDCLRCAQADPRLTPMQCRVFTLLWTFANQDGCNACPGEALLVDCLSTPAHRVHRRSVRRDLGRLEELGYVVLTAPAIKSRGVANTYRVQTPPGLPDDNQPLRGKALRPKEDGLGRKALRPKDEVFRAQSDDFYGANSDGLRRNPASFKAQSFAPPEERKKKERRGEEEKPAAAAPPPPTPAPAGNVEPSKYCSRHQPEGTSDPCTACGDARKRNKTWHEDAERRALRAANRELIEFANRYNAERPAASPGPKVSNGVGDFDEWFVGSVQAGQRRAERATAQVAACRLCDEYGWLLGPDGAVAEVANHAIRCTHVQPPTPVAERRCGCGRPIFTDNVTCPECYRAVRYGQANVRYLTPTGTGSQ